MQAMSLVRPEARAMEFVDNAPVPEPGPGEARIKVLATGICGTDRHIYNWDPSMQDTIRPPLIPGHEFCGEIDKVGPNNWMDLAAGEFVTAEMHVTCGVCYQCRTGQGHICNNTLIYGIHRNGAFAQYVVVPIKNVIRLDRSVVKPRVGAFLDALGNAVHACLAAELAGRSVAILGCGPIGSMSACVAEFCGASTIHLTDINPFALDHVRKWAGKNPRVKIFDVRGEGREQAVAQIVKDTDGGVDVVLDMAGAPTTINDGLRMVRPGGDVVMLGLPAKREILLENYKRDFIFKGVTMKGIIGRKMYDTWYRMLGLLKAGMDVESVVTTEVKLPDFLSGMKQFDAGKAMKVVVYPNGQGPGGK